MLPQDTARRLTMLQSLGHQWMPLQASAILATSHLSDEDLATAADEAKQVSAQKTDGWKWYFDDPVLKKQAPPAEGLYNYVSGTIGVAPISDVELTSVQTGLQQNGYGQNLEADGIWGPEWQDSFFRYGQDVTSEELSGDRAGAIPGSQVLEALSAILPKKSGNALVGFFKAIPGDIRSLIADVAAAGGTVAGSVAGIGRPGSQQYGRRASFAAGAAVENLFRQKGDAVSSAEYASDFFGTEFVGKENKEGFEQRGEISARAVAGQVTQDLGTVFLLKTLGTQVGKFAFTNLPKTLASGISKEEAIRGPGTIARTLVGSRKLAQIEAGAPGTGLLNTKVFSNIPILKTTGPGLGKFLAEDGAYYAFRTAAAAPYKYPIVRAAGQAVQEAGIAGAKVRSVAAIEEKVAGQDTNLSQSVQEEVQLDTLNDAIRNKLNGPLKTVYDAGGGIDWLASFFHGPFRGKDSTAGRAGAAADETLDEITDVTGKLDYDTIIARATDTKLDDNINKLGGIENYEEFWGDKLNRVAASWAAEHKLATHTEEKVRGLSGVARTKWLQNESTRILRTGPQLAQAKKELYAVDSGYMWSEVLRQDIVKSADDVDAYLRHDGKGYLEAVHHVRNRIVPHIERNRRFEKLASRADDDFQRLKTKRHSTEASLESATRTALDDIGEAAEKAGKAEEEAREYERMLNAAKEVDPGWKGLPDLEQDYQGALDRWVEYDALAEGVSLSDTGRSALRRSTMLADEMDDALERRDLAGVFVSPSLGDRPSNYGIARLDTFTSQDVDKAVDAWRAQLATAKAQRRNWRKDPQSYPVERNLDHEVSVIEKRIEREVGELLFAEFRVMGDEMPQNLTQKLEKLDEFKTILASDVILDSANIASDAVTANKQLNDMGYKLVTGSDLGRFVTEPTVLDFTTHRTGFQGAMKKTLGIFNAAPVDDTTIAKRLRTEEVANIQNAVEKHNIPLPPYMNANSVRRIVEIEGAVDRSPGGFRQLLMAVSRTPRKKIVAEYERMLAATGEGAHLDPVQLNARAQKMAEDELQRWFRVADIPRKRFIKTMTDPEIEKLYLPEVFKAKAEAGIPHGLFSVDHAEILYGTYRSAGKNIPSDMVGLSRLDDIMRASMGFAGRGRPGRAAAGAIVGGVTAAILSNQDLIGDTDSLDDLLKDVFVGAGVGLFGGAMGSDRLGYAMANLPNKLIQIRNEVRFSMSPTLSIQEAVERNMLSATADADIPMTLQPFDAMVKAGTLDDDMKILARAVPELQNRYMDEAARLLHQNDVFGFYNNRHGQAYLAGHLSRQGKSDDEIANIIGGLYKYTTGKTSGRSALERSANYVFFPFSFQKKIGKAFGGYLLNRPAQLGVLTRGIAAYNTFSLADENGVHPGSSQWIKNHLPILEEARRLNAFAYGFSAGEFGGINRPMLNLFLPQSWPANADSQRTLGRFVPILRDFDRQFGGVYGGEFLTSGKLAQQARIGVAAFDNARDVNDMWRALRGIPALPGDPRRPLVTEDAQRREAFTMQREVFEKFDKLLDYNESAARSDQDFSEPIRLPVSPEWGKFAGEPITRKVIKEIIHSWYPAYDPTDVVKRFIDKSDQFARYVQDIDDPRDKEQVIRFADLTVGLGRNMDDMNIPPENIKNRIAALRRAATDLASRDSDFYRLYKKNFQYFLGPLERVA